MDCECVRKNNGKLQEEKSGEKVFEFVVFLKDGFNIIVAEAGEVKDSTTP